MADERSTLITIGGNEYEMLLTTKATKEIAKRYGGLSNLGDKLMKSKNFEMALDEVVWLITLLANQSVLVHNLQNHGTKRDLLTEDAVELLGKMLSNKKKIRLLGIKFSELVTGEDAMQENLFDDVDKKENLLKKMDKIRKKYNYDVVKFGRTFGL